jgi:hypothetical protein
MAARQLSLFKGKRQKGEKPPLAKERATHIAVADALEIGANRGWTWTHFPAGELRNPVTAGLLKRMGTKPGWADFLLVSPQGRLHCLELKRGASPLNEAQKAFRNAMGACGVTYAVARSFDEAMILLTLWGAVRLTVTA